MRASTLLSLALSFSLSLLQPVVADDAARAKFAKLAQSNGGVVKLDSGLYDEITKLGRDWSVVIEFTAMGKEYGCAPCHAFYPNFRAVAKSWTKVTKEKRDRHFFATLDFADGGAVFRQLGYASAPVVNFLQAQDGPYKAPANRADWKYDFGRHSFEAQTLADELSESTPVKIPYAPPPNYGLMISSVMTVAGFAALAVFAWPIFSVIVLSRWTWAVGCILASLIFTSGYMFTRIRHAPFAQQTRQGPQWIAGGYSNQYGAEIWVIATLYGALALAQIALIILVPRTLKPTQQRAAIYIWVTVTVLLYSVLMSIFKVKNGSYPFRLLF
ncbi:hypothetical protein DL93DRAFT_1359791 [Clavulina sp. PMI_390]|nr:hypothetical protein DL93DRAFT_1359791 [Clavulina sp. PMI_390]